MDERIFSAFIKYLDKQHEQILDEITKKREELERLEREYYGYDDSRRDSLARQLYALESSPQKDNQAIEKIRKELNSLPSREELEIKIGKLREEIKQLENDFIAKPFKVADSTITPMINFKVDVDGLYIVQDSKTGKYYVKENLDGVALNNYKVEVDENGIPIRQVWIKQDSDTYGLPLKFERPLRITNPIFEVIKPVRKEITKEIPEYKEVKIEKIIPSLTCPRCSWNLTDKMRLINCPNCGLSLFDAVKLAIEKELGASSLKENKKDKKRWIF
jgi:uncharacterized small protein (DUF1192 family)